MPFSLAPAVYTPFRGLDDSDDDGEERGEPSYAEILTKQIKNLTKQQNIVRKNMLFLTQQRAKQLFAKGTEDLRNFEGPDDPPPKLPKGLFQPAPAGLTLEDCEYDFAANNARLSMEHDDGGGTEMKVRTRASIRREMHHEVIKLIQQSAREMEGYDIHAAAVLETYQEELRRLGGNLANILQGGAKPSTELVVPTDHFESPTRRDSASSTFSPVATSPSDVRVDPFTLQSPDRGRKRGSNDDVTRRGSLVNDPY